MITFFIKQPLVFISFFVIINFFIHPVLASAELEPIPLPQTLKEARNTGVDALKTLPKAIKNGWQETLGLLRYWWNASLPWLKIIWFKIKAPFSKEIERRESIIKQEIKEYQIPQSTWDKKSILYRLKKLIK
ncbi:MAG: hypothetical protein AAB565_02180 [Patescibacteria group bacterium]